MIGLTDREKTLAVAAGGPATGFSIALAELNRYWDNHPKGRPEVGHEPIINIRVPRGASEQDGVRAVLSLAEWLGVTAGYACGTFIAKGHFGPPGQGVVLEAHFTPDHDLAHAMRLKAAAELEGTEAA